MSYGAYLVNADGNSIILGKEETYLYWGKVSFTANSSTTPAFTQLFNIPESCAPLVFINSTNLANSNDSLVASTSYLNGKATVYTASSDKTRTITAYVFLLARYVPLSSYGIALWNIDGILAFHSSRPSIKLQGISTLPPFTTGYKTACVAAGSSVINAFGTEYSWVGNDTGIAYSGGFSQQHNGTRLVAARAPYIKTSDYDSYSSLGNYQ